MLIEIIKSIFTIFTWRLYEVSFALKDLYSIDYFIIITSIILYILLILYDIIKRRNLNDIIERLNGKSKICLHYLFLFGLYNRAFFLIQDVQKDPYAVNDCIIGICNLLFVTIRYGIIVYMIWILFKIIKILLKKISNHWLEITR